MLLDLFFTILGVILPAEINYEAYENIYSKDSLIKTMEDLAENALLNSFLVRPTVVAGIPQHEKSYDHLFEAPALAYSESDSVAEWRKIEDESATVSDVSNMVPIEMQTPNGFSETEVLEGLAASTQKDLTPYGGCGPIATMGIVDYFSRSAGFSGLISNPDDHACKVSMATEVLNYSQIMKLDNYVGHAATAELPQGLMHAFNSYVDSHGLTHFLEANEKHTVVGGKGAEFWTDIVNHIDQGLPVTLCTGCILDNDEEGKLQHTVNVYGYETWEGQKTNGETFEKKYLKVRLNWGRETEEYYSADILNYYMVGIVTYDILKYPFDVTVTANQLSNRFPQAISDNSKWFPLDIPPSFSGWTEFKNVRKNDDSDLLLTAYYAGKKKAANKHDSYLEFGFDHAIQKVEFEVSEENGLYDQAAMLYVDCTCIDSDDDETIISYFEHKRIKLKDISTTSHGTSKFSFLLPRSTKRVKFSLPASTKAPSDGLRVHLHSLRICYC